jgi:hypothetical protein
VADLKVSRWRPRAKADGRCDAGTSRRHPAERVVMSMTLSVVFRRLERPLLAESGRSSRLSVRGLLLERQARLCECTHATGRITMAFASHLCIVWSVWPSPYVSAMSPFSCP